MNLRSVTMGRAMETLAQQTRIVPTIMFRSSESVSYGMGELEEPPPDVMELEVQPQGDER